MTSFKYSVILYGNDIVANEAINIGTIINEIDTNTYSSKLIEDVDIVKNIYKNADMELIKIVIEPLRGTHESDCTL